MNNDYNISNCKNFNSKYDTLDISLIIGSFNTIMSEFLLCTSQNIIVQNEEYLLFVIQRGLETLKHCFKMLYMYTKNLKLTIHHCKKAYCYYVEFIGQIGDDNNSYLQLNSKDATLFVYKKTIFEIDNEFKKNFTIDIDELSYINLISNMFECYYEIITYILFNEKQIKSKKDSVIHFSIQKTNKIIEKLCNKNDNINNNINNLNIIKFFLTSLQDFKLDNIKYISINELFIKKFYKNKISIELIQKKIHRSDCLDILHEYTPLKFVNWLFNKTN
jgi:hypothetical protein